MMRKINLSSMIAAIALGVASNNVNAACSHLFYQSKVPQSAKKLRKF